MTGPWQTCGRPDAEAFSAVPWCLVGILSGALSDEEITRILKEGGIWVPLSVFKEARLKGFVKQNRAVLRHL